MKTIGMFFALSFATLAAGAFEVEQVFRPERFVRGDTNVRKQQEIDEASWIWLEGLADWDGDGIADLALGVEDGYLYHFRNPRSR